MKHILAVLGMAVALAIVPGVSAQAATVTFDTIGGVNGDPFATVTEYGITVSSDSGDWRKAFIVGNPEPGLFTLDEVASLEISTGGSFFFVGFDLGTGGRTNPLYSFEGFLGGLPRYSHSGGGVGNAFQTINNPDGGTAVDRVVLTTVLTSSSANIDNVVVDTEAAVPEPATATLLTLAGLAAIRARRRR